MSNGKGRKKAGLFRYLKEAFLFRWNLLHQPTILIPWL